MRSIWTREFLTSRIDRHYLLACWAKASEIRAAHLERARHYRELLAQFTAGALQPAAA